MALCFRSDGKQRVLAERARLRFAQCERDTTPLGLVSNANFCRCQSVTEIDRLATTPEQHVGKVFLLPARGKKICRSKQVAASSRQRVSTLIDYQSRKIREASACLPNWTEMRAIFFLSLFESPSKRPSENKKVAAVCPRVSEINLKKVPCGAKSKVDATETSRVRAPSSRTLARIIVIRAGGSPALR